MDFINRLREKSPAAKRTIAVATSAVVTLAIFGLWASVLHFGASPTSSTSSNITASVAESSGTSGTDVNPLEAFWSVLSTGWGGLVNNINQIKSGTGGAQNFMNTIGESASSASSSSAAVSVSTPVATPASQKDVFILGGSSTNSN